MEKAFKDVHFNCPADLSKHMRIYAAVNDTTVTNIIITAVQEYLATHDKPTGA